MQLKKDGIYWSNRNGLGWSNQTGKRWSNRNGFTWSNKSGIGGQTDRFFQTVNNRLKMHINNQTLDDYTYDAHGNMLTMPHLTTMTWDYADRLTGAGNGTFTSYYNYDHTGNRGRKVVDKGNIIEERYYIGGYEVYKKTVNEAPETERHTLHVMDDTKTVALVETLTWDEGEELTTPEVSVRYQYYNHLGSACLELDEDAEIISYEEYHPFGATSYRSGRSETEVSLKRYKYVGKERDEETGLYYYGARYYAAWLCRFVSVDPLQLKYPYYTPYQYAGNKPISYIDLDGKEEWKINSTYSQPNIDNNGFGNVKTFSFSGTVYGPYKDISAANEAVINGDATVYNFWFYATNTTIAGGGFNNSITSITQINKSGYLPEYSSGDVIGTLFSEDPSSGFIVNNETSHTFFNGRSTGSGATYSTDVIGTITDVFIRNPIQLGLEKLGMGEKAAYWTSSGITIAGMIVSGKYISSKFRDFHVGESKTIVQEVATKEGLVNSSPIMKSLGAASKAEMLAAKLKLNINSPVARQVLNSLDQSVESFITTYRKASIRTVFPGEYLDMTIEEALRSGNTTVRKLLIDGRFVK